MKKLWRSGVRTVDWFAWKGEGDPQVRAISADGVTKKPDAGQFTCTAELRTRRLRMPCRGMFGLAQVARMGSADASPPRAGVAAHDFRHGSGCQKMSDVGRQNIEFVRRCTAQAGLLLPVEDLGDVYSCQVQFHPHSGLVRVRKLRRRDDVALVADEIDYLKRLVTRG